VGEKDARINGGVPGVELAGRRHHRVGPAGVDGPWALQELGECHMAGTLTGTSWLSPPRTVLGNVA